jgi:hypothetical protein
LSYAAIDALTNDVLFAGRVRACCVEQAETFKDAARPDFVALADDCLRGAGEPFLTFTRMIAAAPGIADKAGDPVDQSQVTDADILSTVQADWPTVAALYYAEDGTPI